METVLITGAGRETGIGFEVARQLGKDGYRVILAARRESQLQPLVEKLKAEGISNSSFVVLDITSEQNAKDAAAQIEKEFGKLDVLVNDAGLMQRSESVDEMRIDGLERLSTQTTSGLSMSFRRCCRCSVRATIHVLSTLQVA